MHTEINNIEISAICRAIGQSYPRGNDNLRIATYNLLADGVGFYGSRDEKRAKSVFDLLYNLGADVIGLQEVSRWWFCNFKSNTSYAFVDPLRTESEGLMTAIAYNPEKVMVLEYGNISLKNGSNRKLRRIVWGLFRCKNTGNIFCVVNTHFNVMVSDNSVGLIQAQQLTSFTRKLNDKYNCPVVVTGDFNAKKRGAVSYCTSVVYDMLSLKMSDIRYSAINKGYGVGKGLSACCVDHIFMVGNARVEECVILSQRELLSLSDHYLIFADITL